MRKRPEKKSKNSRWTVEIPPKQNRSIRTIQNALNRIAWFDQYCLISDSYIRYESFSWWYDTNRTIRIVNRTILITMDLKTTKTSGSSYPKPCVAWDHDDFIGNLKVEFITNFITNLQCMIVMEEIIGVILMIATKNWRYNWRSVNMVAAWSLVKCHGAFFL